MNRKWIHRAVSAAVIAGGMLLFGAGAANAAVSVPSNDRPAVLSTTPRVAHPIMASRDLATQQGVVRPGAVFNESATEDLPGVSTAPGQIPTNGTKVDVPQLTGAAGQVVQPVKQLAGPAAGPLDGLTGGHEAGVTDPSGLPVVGPLLGGVGQQAPTDQGAPAQQQPPSTDQQAAPTDSNTGPESTVVPLPVAAPGKVVPLLAVSRSEDGFTVGQNNKLPTDGLMTQAGTTVAGTVGKLAGGPALGSLPNPGGESASPVDGLTGGANVAGLPVNQLTGPVTGQLSGGGLTGPEDAPAAPADQSTGADQQQPAGQQPTDQQQPAGGDQQQPGGAPGVGSDPLSAVTGLLGGGLV
ncbi:hypothetical protein [Actinocatenispora rupis]|uniref:GLTT repeat-containing protein n=1 Tax=Actinocatenispora rupis TaxID=519421 RepID=A0A8J3NE95_9ACTN|nr:hypothetical protein [Actinocatenispora rupis]GID13700.1 hypothetical protein Aru02nite_45890 [Actinocatenispora rupis]